MGATTSPTGHLTAALRAITGGETLSAAAAEAAMGDIMDGTASPLQVAATLGALRMRGETHEEIAGFARAMRARAVRVNSHRSPLVDTCGTGGDAPRHGVNTFNISTAAAFVAASAGAAIAKHGNRAMSSRCGSADVLEALGVNLALDADQIGRCIDEVGIGFMFAQSHHPAMKNVGPIRKELGIRTVFNMLGPLANPAEATAQVVGVSDGRWLEPIANVLVALGSRHAMVAHAEDGLDEFSTCAPTRYIELRGGVLTEGRLDPVELGIGCDDPAKLQGGDAAANAAIIRGILEGKTGPAADIVCLNAAAVLIVADQAADFDEGLRAARASITSGAALTCLNQFVSFTQREATAA